MVCVAVTSSNALVHDPIFLLFSLYQDNYEKVIEEEEELFVFP
jgi:hypothetical protein